VIIFLDPQPFLPEAVESVFAQEYDHWELILVDDGSTDGSTEIARRFAGDHPKKVRYLEHAGHVNRGMSASRNLGLRASRGEYVALLDADDVWLPHKLSTQVAALKAHPEAAMVYDSALHWFPGDPDAAQKQRARELGYPAGSLVQPPNLIPLFLKGEAETPGTCSVLIRRGAFDQVGGFVDSFRGMYEDQAFFYKICLDFPVFLCEGHSALYRQHPKSCCEQAVNLGIWRRDQSGIVRDRFLDWLADYVSSRIAVAGSPARSLDTHLKAYFARRRWELRKRRWKQRIPFYQSMKAARDALRSTAKGWLHKLPLLDVTSRAR
jgi:glycosyltransferase involved in cell wall biosynthesis